MKNVLQSETEKRINELQINASYLPHLPDELPEGMKQLVAIAREKNHEVDLFLMDEPMSKLDAAQHLQMRVFIRKIIGDLGKTTLISSNDPEDALVLSDYLGVMVEGRLLQFGETWEVYNHPANLTVMEMTSRLGLNTIRVEVRSRLTQPYNVPVEKEDGMYNMAFRIEEIKLASEGIPAKISFSRFFDGKRKLGFCEIGESKDVKLMLPIDVEDEISFLPLNPQIFPVREE